MAALSASAEEAERLFATAEREEHDLAFASALRDYEASIATEPSNRYALRARARARWLRARAEADFVPLDRLERVRRVPGAQKDVAQVDALAHDLETFPVGEVRAESRMFVAEAYATTPGRHADAEHELDALLDEAGDGPLRAEAATRLVDLAMTRGDTTTAKHAAERVTAVDTELGVRVAHWIRRRVLERVAAAVIGVFVAASAVAAVRYRPSLGGLRRFAPRAFVLCAYLALAAGALANAFEDSEARPFLLVPACLFPIVVLARMWSLAGARSPLARAARATLGAATVVAVGFLVLDRVDVRYLESFGL